MAKTLYDYWFVQFDFPDVNGKPYKTSGGKMEYNATLKREIPADWEVKTLSQIANITMGLSPAGESYNEDGTGTLFFRVQLILAGFPNSTEIYNRTSENGEERRYSTECSRSRRRYQYCQ